MFYCGMFIDQSRALWRTQNRKRSSDLFWPYRDWICFDVLHIWCRNL